MRNFQHIFEKHKRSFNSGFSIYMVLPLTHFVLLVSFCTSSKHQKTRDFLMLSGGIVRNQWHKMGKCKNYAKLSLGKYCVTINYLIYILSQNRVRDIFTMIIITGRSVNYCHKALHLGSCSSPRSTFDNCYISFIRSSFLLQKVLNPLSANPTKWSNTLN